jgi:hypothetical protein
MLPNVWDNGWKKLGDCGWEFERKCMCWVVEVKVKVPTSLVKW